MKIQSSTIQLESQQVAVKEETKAESLKFWVGNRRPNFENNGKPGPVPRHDRVDLSPQAKFSALEVGKERRASRAGRRDDSVDTDAVSRFVHMITELITGRKVRITSVKPQNEGNDPQKAADLVQQAQAAQAQAQPPAKAGFGFEYDSYERYAEAEVMNFSAQGVVKTADGQQIDFQLQLSMERLFVSEKSTSIRMGDAVMQQSDPLMINFDGTAAQLTDAKFSFDIDVDGTLDQVSFAGADSGFIALDKNGDGQVNDGSELFGPTSGNGFEELAAYDQDRNGWIDENDSVFNSLSVWTKDSEGNDMLTNLKASGVGALYLNSVASPFELKDSSNTSLGTVKSSSIYLAENGTVGTIQQVDLTL